MKQMLTLVFATLLLFGAGSAYAQGRGPGPGPNPDPGPSPGPEARECSLESLLLDLPLENLAPREINDLLFAREEEKLARDVYLSLYQKWELDIFRKIARSEKRHMAAVKVVLDKYGLADPVGANGVGVFSDPTGQLQTLYQALVARGSLSRVDALWVGVHIEEMDIADLFYALGRSNNQDVGLLYQNLMKGSRNHLRAFHKMLVRRDGVYEPVMFLSPETFTAIVSTPSEKGLLDENGDWICGGSRSGRID